MFGFPGHIRTQRTDILENIFVNVFEDIIHKCLNWVEEGVSPISNITLTHLHDRDVCKSLYLWRKGAKGVTDSSL